MYSKCWPLIPLKSPVDLTVIFFLYFLVHFFDVFSLCNCSIYLCYYLCPHSPILSSIIIIDSTFLCFFSLCARYFSLFKLSTAFPCHLPQFCLPTFISFFPFGHVDLSLSSAVSFNIQCNFFTVTFLYLFHLPCFVQFFFFLTARQMVQHEEIECPVVLSVHFIYFYYVLCCFIIVGHCIYFNMIMICNPLAFYFNFTSISK